jgi:hypothetical protein
MFLSADVMRLLLLACLIGMALLAGGYLRRRQLTMFELLWCGALIILVPLLGPYLVMLMQPGEAAAPSPKASKKVQQI